MPGSNSGQSSPGPLSQSVFLLLVFALGLYLAEVIALPGDKPGNAAWRLVGWFLVVVVALRWRVLIAGGVAALRIAAILFIAAALAWAFSGDVTLWRF